MVKEYRLKTDISGCLGEKLYGRLDERLYERISGKLCWRLSESLERKHGDKLD